MASASSQVHLAIQNNINIIIFIALQKRKKMYNQARFPKGCSFSH